jgi:hypothetical protein
MTPDRRQIDGFEKVKEVSGAVLASSPMTKVIRAKRPSSISYGGHTIKVNESHGLEEHVSEVLEDMQKCAWGGKIYSADGSELLENFARLLQYLLVWIGSIKVPQKKSKKNGADTEQTATKVGVSSFVMQKTLEWILSVARQIRSLIINPAHYNYISDAIRQLKVEVKANEAN